MDIVVPLAGPDFILDDGSLKGQKLVRREPLLRYVLNSRPWAKYTPSGNYTFVFLDRPETVAFAKRELADWFPGSKSVFISDYTQGAALSALSGSSLTKNMDTPILIDLADIIYKSDLDPRDRFLKNSNCGGLALTFESENPIYSYLEFDDSGKFKAAAEKKVISRNASAGTYIFRNLATYLSALAYVLENPLDHTYLGRYFVCPLFNGVHAQGLSVEVSKVSNVLDIKVENTNV